MVPLNLIIAAILCFLCPCAGFTETDLRNALQFQTQVCNYVPLCNISASETSRPKSMDHPFGFCCRGCSCKDDCRIKGNCCPDKTFENTAITDTDLKFECRFADLKRTKQPSYSGRPFLMVVDCPLKSGNGDLKKQCTDGTDDNSLSIRGNTPVYSIRTRRVYVNRFCSLCHSELEKDIIPWAATIKCSKDEFLNIWTPDRTYSPNASTYEQNTELLISNILAENSCNVVFDPPSVVNINENECSSVKINECNITGVAQEYEPWIAEACQAINLPYGLPVYDKLVYQNIFCYLCNQAVLTSFKSEHCFVQKSRRQFSCIAEILFYQNCQFRKSGNKWLNFYN